MIGNKINKYLAENGIKKSFLAEKVGITQAQISLICSDSRKIDCVTYYKICKALNLPLEFFMEGIE